MPAFPNPAKVANKAAAFQMLMAVALECEYQTHISEGQNWVEDYFEGARESWLTEYTREEEECIDPILETIDNEPNNNWWDDGSDVAEHDYYHATI